MIDKLDWVQCKRCENARNGLWYRVWTSRAGRLHCSELSWDLARRLIPKLLATAGVAESDTAGVFGGAIIWRRELF